jgi:hypothetical protein
MTASGRIAEILEVIEEVRAQYFGSTSRMSIAEIRSRAVDNVARRRGIYSTTVSDKFRRQLDPPVKNTGDFDRLLERWLRDGSDELERVLDNYAITEEDRDYIYHVFEPSTPSTATAVDIAEPSQPVRVQQQVYRILRDTALARFVKELYGYRCQICQQRIDLPQGPYAEAHHLKPLGKPHDGPDVQANILCLCPNHHVLMDYGAITVTLADIQTHPQHIIDPSYTEYHNSHVYRSSNVPT